MISNGYKRIRVYKLDNGLEVIIFKDPKRVTCHADFIVNVGAKDDTKRLSGISHFCEHILFSGNMVNSKQEIDSFFDNCGATINAFTCREYIQFYCTVLSEYLESTLFHMRNMIIRKNVNKSDVEGQRLIIKKEIEKQSSDDMIKNILKASNPKQSYKLDTRGTLESVDNISAYNIKSHFKKYFNPKNTVLILNGYVPNNILETVTTLFSDWQGDEVTAKQIPKHHWNIKSSINKTDDDRICFLGVYKDTDINFAVSDIGNELVRSHLENELREVKKIVYSIVKHEEDVYDNKYIFYKAFAKKENIKEIKEYFENLKYLKISENDFQRIKNKKTLNYTADTEDLQAILLDLALSKLFNREYLDPSKKIKMYKNVSLDDVQQYILNTFVNPKIILEGNISKEDII